MYGDESLQEHLSKTGHHPAMAMMLVLFKLPEEHVMKSEAGLEQEQRERCELELAPWPRGAATDGGDDAREVLDAECLGRHQAPFGLVPPMAF